MGSGKKLSRRGGNHGAVNPANGDGGEILVAQKLETYHYLRIPRSYYHPLFLLLLLPEPPLFHPAFYLAALKNKTEGGPRLNNG